MNYNDNDDELERMRARSTRGPRRSTEDRTLPRAGLTHLSGDPAYPQPVRLPLIGPLQEPAYGTIMMMNIILMRSLARRNMEGGTGGRWILTLPTAAGDMKMMSTVTWMMSFMMHLRAEPKQQNRKQQEREQQDRKYQGGRTGRCRFQSPFGAHGKKAFRQPFLQDTKTITENISILQIRTADPLPG